MSNCWMRRPAKFHVDSAVRFWAIANIREGGGRQTPPPGQARVNCLWLPANELTTKLLVRVQSNSSDLSTALAGPKMDGN